MADEFKGGAFNRTGILTKNVDQNTLHRHNRGVKVLIFLKDGGLRFRRPPLPHNQVCLHTFTVGGDCCTWMIDHHRGIAAWDFNEYFNSTTFF